MKTCNSFALCPLLSRSMIIFIFIPVMVMAQENSGEFYKSYVGNYEITPTFIVSITFNKDTLYAQSTGQKKFELKASSQHGFDYKGSNQAVEFVVDENGKVNSIKQRVETYTRVAKRVDIRRTVPINVFSQAVLSGNVKEVKALVAEGADIHGLDTEQGGPNGRRPLNFAALQNDLDMINALLELGADINGQNLSGFTPLHHAVESESLDAIELLINKDADFKIKNRSGVSPSELAVVWDRPNAAKALEAAINSNKK